jgi:hypothetical protein
MMPSIFQYNTSCQPSIRSLEEFSFITIASSLFKMLDSIEVDNMLVGEVQLKHWECTIMSDIAGLEGGCDILQYTKPNVLAKDLQLIMKCTSKGFPKQYMVRFPSVYSGEIMWDMLKSAICKVSEEQGYTLRSVQGKKSVLRE